jgi:hypothetical protein
MSAAELGGRRRARRQRRPRPHRSRSQESGARGLVAEFVRTANVKHYREEKLVAAKLIFGVLCVTWMSWPSDVAAQLVDDAGVDLLETETVYTLTNLHPDEVRTRLYAVNFQQPGLIPRCTAVRITKLRRSAMNFVVIERSREYEYLNHDAAAEPFNDHLLRFFGSKCDASDTRGLNEKDLDGIRRGIVQPGMTRRGVILAIGYPPRHVNPSIEFGDWTYWRHRYDRFIVRFNENDIVVGIMN